MTNSTDHEGADDAPPAVVRDPRPFRFGERSLAFRGEVPGELLGLEPLGDHATDAIAVDQAAGLYRIDLAKGTSQRLLTLTDEELPGEGAVSVVTSQDGAFVAVTRGGCAGETSFNSGVVVDLESGMCVLRLDCGDYQVHHTLFPVAFVEHGGKTLVIHGTDWNRVDVTDPRTGECLTQREEQESENDEIDRSKTVFTEWLGELRVSPDQSRVATIGWMWHPVGHAFSWSLDDWLGGNPWEPDRGESKRSYAIWSYFWFSPFFWYDDSTLCIWGDPERMDDRDVPANSVVLYSADSGEALRSFAGPTMDGFYFDRYLFTETEEGDGLCVWDVSKGALLHTERGVSPRMYHRGMGEFIGVSEGRWTAWSWKTG